MKKIAIALLAVVFLFSGCGNGKDTQKKEFTLSSKERQKYEEKIDQTLYDFYWRYDEDTVLFFPGNVPEEKESNENIFLAAEDAGFSLRNSAGKSAIVATVQLQHYNGDTAGLAYFYFIHEQLRGVYYSGGYDKGNYSLKVRNLYLADGKFAAYETDAPMKQFSEGKTQVSAEGFVSTGKDAQGNVLTVAIENGRAIIYRYKRGFQKYRTIYGEGGLTVMGATFLAQGNGGLAILLGKTITSGHDEGETTYMASERVIFYNASFDKAGQAMQLSTQDYTCLGQDGAELVMANGNILEYYHYGNNGWEKKRQYFLQHGVTQFHIADLDGNGVPEYLMTDGLDLYMYHKTESGFIKIWSTHVGIETLSGAIYTGDLNQDGVKEVYVCDTTGTAIRYVLTTQGLRARNEDIEYGDRFYTDDFNGDGKDDYIGITDVENLYRKLHMAQ